MFLPDFILIPCQLLKDKKLTPLDRIAYGYIYWCVKLKNEKCTAGNQTLANLCGVSPGSLQNSLTRLERQGYIKRKFADEKHRKRSEIIPLVIFAKVSSDNDTVSSTNDSGYHQPMTRIRAVKKKTINTGIMDKLKAIESQATRGQPSKAKEQLRQRFGNRSSV